MLVIVSYDVATTSAPGRRRLRRVAKTCLDFGQRVQNSVFECLVDAAQWTRLKQRLLKEYDPDEDSLRFYFLGNNWRSSVEHHGTKKTRPLDEPSSCRGAANLERPRKLCEVRGSCMIKAVSELSSLH